MSNYSNNDNDILTSEELDFINQEYIKHYGTPRHSGRYPWGSGDDPFQHGSDDFIAKLKTYKDAGMSDKEIADAMGMKTTEFRDRRSIAVSQEKARMVKSVQSMHGDGMSNVAIGEKLGIPESTVRNYLNYDIEAKRLASHKTALFIKDQVDQKGMVDIGAEVERELGVSKEKLRTAVRMLQDEGYEVYNARVEQATNKGQYTTLKVLATPGTEYKDVYADKFANVKTLTDYTSDDGGETFRKAFVYPASLDSNRVAIRYAEEGGLAKDGLIEIRRGCKDIELDGSTYAQVRILVDGTHYMKGMAVYSDDVPEGKDIIFNTNKKLGTPALGEDKANTVLKHIKKDDPENPFGSAIKEDRGQHYYIDENGEKHLSVINKRAEEGDWNDWSKDIASQMLAKQPKDLIKQQINISKVQQRNELDEIKELTNPTVKKAYLEEFADGADKAAVELKAAGFAGAKFQVILPLATAQADQCYAPNYPDGAELALIRYPHTGTFEIPIVTNNTKLAEGIDHITPHAKDAIGISSKAAERLSGADFDGDTVVVIPITNKSQIRSTPALPGLVDFDPKLEYQATDWSDDHKHLYRNGIEFQPMTQTQKQMGMISNLITDMTLKGATREEMERAVKHSMVVIDAEKHQLDYKQSEIDNGIKALKDKYQGVYNEKTGKMNYPASTLLSAAKSELRIPEIAEGALFDRQTGDPVKEIRKDRQRNPEYFNEVTGEKLSRGRVQTVNIDPETGEKLWHPTNREFIKVTVPNEKGKNVKVSAIDRNGELVYKDPVSGEVKKVTSDMKLDRKPALTSVTKMSVTKDAYSLSSGTVQENIYADYANYLKSLANEARKEYISTVEYSVDPAARKEYKDEVRSLNEKLDTSLKNAPRERQAQVLAASRFESLKKDNPSMDDETQKKLKQRLLSTARAQVGASRKQIEITDKEWQAIQSKAISTKQLKNILRYSDKERLRELSMPKSTVVLSDAKINRLNSMINSGYTNSEIANVLGVSVATVQKYSKGGK